MQELLENSPPKVDDFRVAPMVRYCCNLLGERLERGENVSGLAVGCGNGNEVVYMRRFFGSRKIVGLDIEGEFSSATSAERCVLRADAKKLPFRSGAFDFATSFHSLEHVGDAGLALDELCRILRPGGWFYVGVPNKSRFVAYLGSYNATTWEKIRGNLVDWRDRLRGRFENELGGHAGFGRNELLAMLGKRFASVRLITEDFIRFKYEGRLPKRLLDLVLAPRIMDYTVPAHYALCQRRLPGEACGTATF